MYFIFLLMFILFFKMKFHLKIAKKFLPTRLLEPTRLLNLKIISQLHGYLDSTLIRYLGVQVNSTKGLSYGL